MTNATADLMAALEGDEVTGPIADPDASTIDTVTEWVAQVVRLDAQEAEYAEAHKTAVARLNARKAERLAAIGEQRSYLVDAIETFHRARLAQDPEALTIHTPAGTMKSTKRQDQWVIEDDATFTAWCVANLPDAVTFADPVVNKGTAKKVLKEKAERYSDQRVIVGGEAVPGLRFIEADPVKDRNFSVVPG